MLPDDLEKHREISFFALPPDQVPRALGFLQTFPDLEVGASSHKCCLWVAYDLRRYTLQTLENLLVANGYHLDNTLYSKLKRALVHYVEDVERENLGAHDSRERAKEIFACVYDEHLHGDRDDTPEDWRMYY